ncbi:hypothetical protein D3C87_227070 [compost metagenome]
MKYFRLLSGQVFTATFLLCLITGCKQPPRKITFDKKENAQVSGLAASVITIQRYSSTFNPKAFGTITIKMTDSSSYQAKDMDAAQFNAMISLIRTPGVIFTQDEEFILKGGPGEH